MRRAHASFVTLQRHITPFGRRWGKRGGLMLLLALTGALVGCASAAAGTGGTPARATATPTVPATTAGRLTQLVRQAVGKPADAVDVTYDEHNTTAVATITVHNGVPTTDDRVAAAHELVKLVAFEAQQALWKSGVALREATVVVQGLQLDEYGSQVIDSYGSCIVEASTAQHLDWIRLSVDHAWDGYDHTWLRESFLPEY